MERDPRYFELKKRIQKEGLSPDNNNLGKFIKKSAERSGIRFLYPENWVFHPDIVKKVLEGDYDRILPYSAEFDATMNCSNRCGICAYKCPKELEFVWLRNNFSDPEVHMQSLPFAKELLDKLIDGGIKGITFTGGGEPFLFPKLEELVIHATERGVDSVVYTNGNVISEERVRRVIEATPLLVRVSLNAGTKEVYNRFHNPFDKERAFERCLRTIQGFAQGSVANPKISVGVGVVITRTNRYDLVEAAKRIREITEKTGGGIEFITYRPAYEYYDSEQLGKDLLQETYDIVEQRVRKVLEGTRVRVANVSCRYKSLMQDTRNYSKCRGSGLYAELGPNGNLYFCCDRHFNRRCIIGDLRKQTLLDIHLGQQRTNFLEFINSNQCTPCPPACKSHELNRQFQEVECLRERKELYKAELWIEELQKLPPPKMINF